MKTFVAAGNVQPFTAAADVAAGEIVIIGTLPGVAQAAVANGAAGLANIGGVYTLTKVGSQAWTVGAKVYWDATNKRCTTTATDNTLIGVAYEAVGSGAGLTTGKVRLDGVCV